MTVGSRAPWSSQSLVSFLGPVSSPSCVSQPTGKLEIIPCTWCFHPALTEESRGRQRSGLWLSRE